MGDKDSIIGNEDESLWVRHELKGFRYDPKTDTGCVTVKREVSRWDKLIKVVMVLLGLGAVGFVVRGAIWWHAADVMMATLPPSVDSAKVLSKKAIDAINDHEVIGEKERRQNLFLMAKICNRLGIEVHPADTMSLRIRGLHGDKPTVSKR